MHPQLYVCASHALGEIYYITVDKSRMSKFRNFIESKVTIAPRVSYFSVDITSEWAAKHKEFWNAK